MSTNNLKKAGWNSGCISSTDHKPGGNFGLPPQSVRTPGALFVRSDQKLNGFLELETAIRQQSRQSCVLRLR
ncbi:MAG: hypothetical protein DMF05_06420 [Verrucomicrobia bacterium]|nr:MAG: hypothetical protein DMF05_06420 [Verrucomicrobiota bacterium]